MRTTARTKAAGGGIIVGGVNYGQGSSREHAALAPLQLGIRAVIVKSFARMHRDNLINSGILPLVFSNETDYDGIDIDDALVIKDPKKLVAAGVGVVENKTKKTKFEVKLELTDRQKKILLAGGTVNLLKSE